MSLENNDDFGGEKPPTKTENVPDAPNQDKPETSKEEIKSKVLDCINAWLIKASIRSDNSWDEENFAPVKLPEEHPNEIYIGKIEHLTISNNPKLIATLFTQKFGKRGNLKNNINCIISSENISKQNLIDSYDSNVSKEIIAFNLELEYNGDNRHKPGRHCLKHRFIADQYRGEGFGSQILKLYENFIQTMANQKNSSQSLVIDCSNLTYDSAISSGSWAIKNNYTVYDLDKENWESVKDDNNSSKKTAKLVFQKNFDPTPR